MCGSVILTQKMLEAGEGFFKRPLGAIPAQVAPLGQAASYPAIMPPRYYGSFMYATVLRLEPRSNEQTFPTFRQAYDS